MVSDDYKAKSLLRRCDDDSSSSHGDIHLRVRRCDVLGVALEQRGLATSVRTHNVADSVAQHDGYQRAEQLREYKRSVVRVQAAARRPHSARGAGPDEALHRCQMTNGTNMTDK